MASNDLIRSMRAAYKRINRPDLSFDAKFKILADWFGFEDSTDPTADFNLMCSRWCDVIGYDFNKMEGN